LQKGTVNQPDNLPLIDLMWKYYEKRNDFAKAAHTLEFLAEKRSDEISLQQRLEYLSRATMCSTSVTSHTTTLGDGKFLDQLEDKLEVRFCST
jgi:nuclear pore complex protein Nup155